MRPHILAGVLASFGLCSGYSDTPVAPAAFPSALMEAALAAPAPAWRYTHAKRYREIDATFAFYTLALSAYQSPPTERPRLAEAAAERLRSVLAGGHEPEAQGGLGGWTHGPFAWTLAFIRHTPPAWGRLSPEEQERADLLMEALAVAAHFCLDDDNHYRCLIDGDPNWAKGMNPNHIEGYVGVAMAASWYFGGAEALDERFERFDFDSFERRLRSAGFTNILAAWTHSPLTRLVLMQGGAFDPEKPALGLGRGVRGNAFTYLGHRADAAWPIYRALAKRMFSRTAQSVLPIDGRDETVHIIDLDSEGRPLRSPFDGKTGMCYEFLTTNAQINGTRFRSSLLYVYEGWMLDMANGAALRARGLWPAPAEIVPLRTHMTVGTADFFFKARHGYSGFANGKRVNASERNLESIGWRWSRAWWAHVIAPTYVVPEEFALLETGLE